MIDKLKILAVSLKFYSLVAATWLFAVGTLSENGWIMIVLPIVGMKEASKLAGHYRDIKLGKVKK